MSIGLDTRLTRNAEILHAPVSPEETVMLSVAAGRYYALNATATRIWDLLENPKTIGEVAALLREEFEVDQETCVGEVLTFANELVENGILLRPAP